jgi:hypothetical protein
MEHGEVNCGVTFGDLNITKQTKQTEKLPSLIENIIIM